MPSTPSDTQAVIDALEKRDLLKTLDLAPGVKVIARPDGVQIESIKDLVDEYSTAPERKRGTAELADLDSFIAHAKRFADEHSAIFADTTPAAPSLLSVLDYHEPGKGSPRFGSHRGRYAFPLSDEWKAWQKSDGATFDQKAFAEFLEDRIVDVADPEKAGDGIKALVAQIGTKLAPAARLLEVARGLTIHVNERVTQAFNTNTGEASIMYASQHDEQTKVGVPGAFLIAVPVFRNGPRYVVAARLRYRVNGGSIVWFYQLQQAAKRFEDAIADACTLAREGTGLPLFVGKPEA